MTFDITTVTGIGGYDLKTEGDATIYSVTGGGRAFLVTHPNTIEVRTDPKLGTLLDQKYETVMKSRYFGRAGIEIVTTGQITEIELADLVRLSYALTVKMG